MSDVRLPGIDLRGDGPIVVEVSRLYGGTVAVTDPAQVICEVEIEQHGPPVRTVLVRVDGVDYHTTWTDAAALREAVARKLERAEEARRGFRELQAAMDADIARLDAEISGAYMPVREFVERGFLHEVNRKLLHPHGLALEVTEGKDGEMRISGVQNHRSDPAGVVFAEVDQVKANQVTEDALARRPAREAALGFWVQPLPSDVLADAIADAHDAEVMDGDGPRFDPDRNVQHQYDDPTDA